MVKISIVVPGYNEAGTIPLLVERIDSFFTKNNVNGEIVFVNDGSTDNTRAVLEDLEKKYKRLRAIHHNTNLGLTRALMTCFREAKGDEIVFLPADLESDPQTDIPALLNKLESGYDLVCGWRTNRKGTKKFASYVYNMLSRALFHLDIHDLNWIKAFKKEVVKDMHLRSGWHRYIPILAKYDGYKIGEVETKMHPRMCGKSKFGTGRLLVGLLDLLVVKFHMSFSERPMLVFGSVGLLFSFSGFLGALYALWIKLSTGSIGYKLPFLLLVVVLLVTGVQLFAIGFIAEYIASFKDSLRK